MAKAIPAEQLDAALIPTALRAAGSRSKPGRPAPCRTSRGAAAAGVSGCARARARAVRAPPRSGGVRRAISARFSSIERSMCVEPRLLVEQQSLLSLCLQLLDLAFELGQCVLGDQRSTPRPGGCGSARPPACAPAHPARSSWVCSAAVSPLACATRTLSRSGSTSSRDPWRGHGGWRRGRQSACRRSVADVMRQAAGRARPFGQETTRVRTQ